MADLLKDWTLPGESRRAASGREGVQAPVCRGSNSFATGYHNGSRRVGQRSEGLPRRSAVPVAAVHLPWTWNPILLAWLGVSLYLYVRFMPLLRPRPRQVVAF